MLAALAPPTTSPRSNPRMSLSPRWCALACGVLLEVACAGKRIDAPRLAHDPSAAVDEFARIHQLHEQIAGLRDILALVKGQMPPQTRESFARHLAPEVLEQNARNFMRANYDEKRARAALEWLRTPLARRELAASPCTDAERSKLPDGRSLRGKLIEQYLAASGYALEMEILERMPRALLEAFPKEKVAPALPLIGNGLEILFHMLRKSLQPEILALAMCGMRNLSDAELLELTKFYESDTGRWYARYRRDALVEAILQGIRGVGADLAKQMSGGRRPK